jgi:hypothetical protein
MSGIAIIANPNARRNREWPLAAQQLRKAAPGAVILETRSPDELAGAAKALKADRPKVLAIAGGDGTVTHTVTALAGVMGDNLPPLALLGGGAYDSLAPLGGKGDAEDRLRRLSEALASGAELRFEQRDTLRVEGRIGLTDTHPPGGPMGCSLAVETTAEKQNPTSVGLKKKIRMDYSVGFLLSSNPTQVGFRGPAAVLTARRLLGATFHPRIPLSAPQYRGEP